MLLGSFLAVAVPGLALAEDVQPVTQADLQKLMQEFELQKKKLAAQEQALAEQQRVIANQQNQLNFLKTQVGVPDDPELVPVAYNLGNAAPSGSTSGVLRAQDSQAPVGEAPPEEETRPQVAVLQDEGGVLTRRGQLIIEPQIEYVHSSSNRFFFQGFEIIDTVLLGLIEATEADRDTIIASIGARIGVTDKFELEARIPYVYRNDRVENTIISLPSLPIIQEQASGSDIGDVEFAGHYQVTGGPVYTVANLRVKAPTGTDPFEVDVDAQGNATELSTGSGFWSLQPSFTAIFPTDPVVFFGSVGYTWNIERDIGANRNVADPNPAPPDDSFSVLINEVDPGDAVNVSFGMGLSLNERTSVSVGFKYDYVFETTQNTVVTDAGGTPTATTVDSDVLQVGSFQVGFSYQVFDNVGINLNFSVGATEDAPDFQTSLRVPIRFQVF